MRWARGRAARSRQLLGASGSFATTHLLSAKELAGSYGVSSSIFNGDLETTERLPWGALGGPRLMQQLFFFYHSGANSSLHLESRGGAALNTSPFPLTQGGARSLQNAWRAPKPRACALQGVILMGWDSDGGGSIPNLGLLLPTRMFPPWPGDEAPAVSACSRCLLYSLVPPQPVGVGGTNLGGSRRDGPLVLGTVRSSEEGRRAREDVGARGQELWVEARELPWCCLRVPSRDHRLILAPGCPRWWLGNMGGVVWGASASQADVQHGAKAPSTPTAGLQGRRDMTFPKLPQT